MSASLHPAAPHHLPPFVTAPGESDVLMVVMAVFLVVAVLAVGLLFLRLHTLPERIAHKSHKLQFEIVAVLGLLALFTHQHIFWVAGLLLALIDFPEFGRPLGRIADSLETIAGGRPQESAGEMPDGLPKAPDVSVAEIARREVDEGPDGTPAPSRKPKERIHA
jgi:multisubunit Na+/H+ antiporter MnhF subunit